MTPDELQSPESSQSITTPSTPETLEAAVRDKVALYLRKQPRQHYLTLFQRHAILVL
jgi:hypothetical protein